MNGAAARAQCAYAVPAYLLDRGYLEGPHRGVMCIAGAVQGSPHRRHCATFTSCMLLASSALFC